MNKLFLLLLTAVPLCGMDRIERIRKEETGAKPKLFAIRDRHGAIQGIKREHMDPLLRNMTSHQLLNMFEKNQATLEVTEYTNGEKGLRIRPVLKGGGYFLGQAFFWGARMIGYGVPATAAVATIATVAAPVIAGAGIAGAAAGAATVAAEGAIAAGTASAMASGAAVAGGAAAAAAATATGGATLVGGAIVGGAGVQATALATGSVAASTGSAAGYIAVVEGVATAGLIIGNAIWWLP